MRAIFLQDMRTGGASRRVEVGELAPERNPRRWEALVARIVAEAEPLLEARRRTLSLTLTQWGRPVMVGAAGLMAAVLATLLLVPTADTPTPVQAGLGEEVVAWSVVAWMDGSDAPLAIEEYSP
ncbi:MAG: hypothetical protein J4F34_07425 [Gemmatimonadetes bacterium]|nr:hypothetical protein [Gemmatimonadota bacterium]